MPLGDVVTAPLGLIASRTHGPDCLAGGRGYRESRYVHHAGVWDSGLELHAY